VAGRAPELALAGLAIAAVCWAGYTFGPKPSADSNEAPPPVPATATSPPAAPEAERAAEGTLPALLNITRTPVAKGESEDDVETFLGKLARIYRDRGFQEFSMDQDPSKLPKIPKKMTKAPPPKIYFRAKCPYDTLIGMGPDADVTSGARNDKASFYMTAVVPRQGGGCRWETHEMSQGDPQEVIAKLNDPTLDLPGEDAPAVPRYPGARRMFTSARQHPNGRAITTLYQAQAPATVTQIRQYLSQAMIDAGWRFDQLSTVQGAQFDPSLLCYIQGEKFCTLQITQSAPGDPVSIVVNYR
jgi:hypothetical protein